MFKKTIPILFSTVLGLAVGVGLNRTSLVGHAYAQDVVGSAQSNQILVHGHGRAISALAPPGEQFELIPSTTPRRSFTVVPEGKKFVLTDVMYETQGSVQQKLTVNIDNSNPFAKTYEILFQVMLEPLKADQVHLCSGYVIPAGNSLVAYTNAGLMPEQYVSVSVTGYLTDQ